MHDYIRGTLECIDRVMSQINDLNFESFSANNHRMIGPIDSCCIVFNGNSNDPNKFSC